MGKHLDKAKELLDKHGEVILKTDDGDEFELHKDADFEEGFIHIDDSEVEFWLDPAKVEFMYIHPSGKET